VATVSRGSISERYRFIQRNRKLGITFLCLWANVSKSEFYDWCNRGLSDHALQDIQLSQKILQIHQESRATYGSPRVHEALKDEGYRIGRKRVECLMRQQSLVRRVVKVTRHAPGLKRSKESGENL
jgi:putative transposase